MSAEDRGGSPGHGPARGLDDTVRWGGEESFNFAAPGGVAKIVYTSRALSQIRTARPTTWSVIMQVNPDLGSAGFAGEGAITWTAVFILLTGVGQSNMKLVKSATFQPGLATILALPVQVEWQAVPASHITAQVILVRGGLAIEPPNPGPFTGNATSICAPYVVTEEGAHRTPPAHVPYGMRREPTYGERLNGEEDPFA
jgi:hypothetical protein